MKNLSQCTFVVHFSRMSTRLHGKLWGTLAFFPVLLDKKPNPNDNLEKTVNKSSKSGTERVIDLFKLDEFGSPSKELLTTLHTATFSGLLGGSLAGLKESQMKFQDFVTKLNSEMFTSHTEAKSVLTQKMATSFVQAFVRWGGRMAFFSSLFTLNISMLGAYYEETSIWNFIASGVVTGSVYRIPLGLRGMIVAGTLGGCLGLFAGSMSLGIMKLLGSNYDEIQAWHYEMRNMREEKFEEAMDYQEQLKQNNPLLEERTKILKSAALEAVKDLPSENHTSS